MSVSDDLDRLLYDGNPFKDWEETFETCSIVGNAGELKGRGAGNQIDSSEAVIRMNAAPVQGHEEDVGSKTTIRMINALLQKGKTLSYTTTSKGWVKELRNETVVWVPVTERSINRGNHLLHNSSEVIKLSQEFKEHVWDHCKNVLRKRPSTGLTAIILAYCFCEELRIFGFGFNRKEGDKKHYWEDWDDSEGNSSSSHRWDYEQKLINCLCKRDDNVNVVKTN